MSTFAQKDKDRSLCNTFRQFISRKRLFVGFRKCNVYFSDFCCYGNRADCASYTQFCC